MRTVTQLRQRERFGRALKTLRLSRNLSQATVVEMVGTSQTTYSGWERGASVPDPDEVFSIERQLGVDPGTLSAYLGYVPNTVEPPEPLNNPALTAPVDDDGLSQDEMRELEAALAPLIETSTKIADMQQALLDQIDALRRGTEAPPPAHRVAEKGVKVAN